MDPKLLHELEATYAEWEEAERRHAHMNDVFKIIESLKESDEKERQYQHLRLKHSPAYFSGSLLYRGDRFFGGGSEINKGCHYANDGIEWGKRIFVWMVMYGELLSS